MENWSPVKDEADIADLLEQYAYFLDSCLVRAHYVTGMSADDAGMVFAAPAEKALHLVFHSQCTDRTLELCFTGVRQCQLTGWQDHHSGEIDSCYLAVRRDLLLPRRDDPLIVWADRAGFDPKEPVELLREPLTAFVIASDLKWRFAES